jgi:hypothetical protein
MRKVMLGAIAAVMGLSFVPASAEVGNGLQAIGADSPGGYSDTYTSTGAATSLLVLTPNAVELSYINEDEEKVVVYSNDSADPAAQGLQAADAIPAGEVVTLTVGPDSAEVIEGWIGAVIVSETA